MSEDLSASIGLFKEPLAYRVGDLTDHGRHISYIVAQRKEYIVYVADDGKPGFECSAEIRTAKTATVAKHDELVWRTFNSLPRKARDLVLRSESYALANAFAYDGDRPECFESVEKLLQAKMRECFTLWHIAGCFATVTGTGALAVALSVYAPAEVAPLEVGVIGGVLGAFTSVLQRSVRLGPQSYHSKTLYFLGGVGRGILGIIFGGVMVALVQANIVFGVVRDDMWYLGVLTFIAGINERRIPDILARTPQ